MINQKHINKYYLSIATLFIFISMIGVGSAVGTYPSVDPNMVGYYHFNNDSSVGENDSILFDYSGSGHNGSITGPKFLANSSFLGDGVYVFNGTNGVKIRLTDAHYAWLNLSNNFTISAWVNIKNNNTSMVAFSHYASGDSVVLGFQGNEFRFRVFNSTVSYNSSRTFATARPIPNVWYYLVAIKNDTDVSLIVNDLVYTGRTGITATSATTGTIIGANQNQQSAWNGWIDELIIYNRSLSITEASTLYKNYFHCSSTPLDGCMVNNSLVLNRTTYYQYLPMKIIQDNIVLDGNGSTIYYNFEHNILVDGIYVGGFNNITIKNFNLIQNTTIDSTQLNSHGINLVSSNYSSVYGNNITTQGDIAYCILFDFGSSNGNIYNNNCTVIDGKEDTWGIHLNNHNKYNRIFNNSVWMNSSVTSAGYAEGDACILLEYESDYNNITDNTCINYANEGVGLYFAENVSFNNVLRNKVDVYGRKSMGMWLGLGEYANGYFGARYNTFSYNNLTSHGGFQSRVITIDSNYTHSNLFINNIINNSNGTGIYFRYWYPNGSNYDLWGGSSYNNSFINNSIYINGVNGYVAGDGTTDNYPVYFDSDGSINNLFSGNSFFYKSVLKTFEYYVASFSNISFYQIFDFGAISLLNVNMSIISQGSDYLILNNTNVLDDSLNINNLSNALLIGDRNICSGSSGNVSSNLGNITISIPSNKTCIVLNNYNLTIGVARQNSFYNGSFYNSTSSTPIIFNVYGSTNPRISNGKLTTGTILQNNQFTWGSNSYANIN